jgi:hypothetical protein
MQLESPSEMWLVANSCTLAQPAQPASPFRLKLKLLAQMWTQPWAQRDRKWYMYTYIYTYTASHRPNWSAAERRQHYSRAYASAKRPLLRKAALQHRGCHASDLGKALAQALKCTAGFVYFAFFFRPWRQVRRSLLYGGCRLAQTLLDYWPLDVYIYIYT